MGILRLRGGLKRRRTMLRLGLLKSGAVALSILLAAGTAFAASDGTVGANSTGTSDISVTIPKLIRARSFSDYTTASYAGTGDINQNDDLNISANYSGTYKVKATSSTGSFVISDGSQT